ncbi:MAG TPA: hypothetical protein DIW43_14870 [Spongiibacteraceae bacterium]|nr:hypothetical protein [Spongiibacteraceae bacterium]HCS28738.1 hypothetical protein [Spongiibacteraceae bacterium]
MRPADTDTKMNHATPQLSKGERTARRILDAAEALVSARGYRATTVREIARAAGIQEPGLYNHFKSKEALFSAMLDRALQPLATAIDQQLQATPAFEKLPGQIGGLLALHPNIPILFQQALMAPHDNPGHELVIVWLKRLMEKGLELLPTNSGSSDTRILHLIAMFNIASGYFTANTLIEALLEKSTLNSDLLAQQRSLADELAAFLLQRKIP